jgi:uncharacterized protein
MSLFDAIAARDVEALTAQLAAGESPDLSDDEGRTPLTVAAEAGETALVRVLLAHGADPRMTDRMQETPLLKAAAHGHRDVYALLLPFASEDERDLSARMLRLVGAPDVPPPPPDVTPDVWRRALADVTVTISSLLGDDAGRLRLDRALQNERRRK